MKNGPFLCRCSGKLFEFKQALLWSTLLLVDDCRGYTIQLPTKIGIESSMKWEPCRLKQEISRDDKWSPSHGSNGDLELWV